MADLPTTTMRAAHEAILATARAAFGSAIRQYGAYEPLGSPAMPETELLTPALLLELEGFEQEDEDGARGDSRVLVRCAWALHIWLSALTPSLQVALPELASDLLILIRTRDHDLRRAQRGNRWGLGPACGYPQRVEAMPAQFQPGLNGRDSWLVRWDQSLYLPLTFTGL